MLSQLNDSWNIINQVPEEIQLKAKEWDYPEISIKNWIAMDMLQRFALVKLSRSDHEGRNFPIALKEFRI